jgi:hypothetical protein
MLWGLERIWNKNGAGKNHRRGGGGEPQDLGRRMSSVKPSVIKLPDLAAIETGFEDKWRIWKRGILEGLV